MKYGDISNKVAGANIGFRLNNFLVEKQQLDFLSRLKGMFTGNIDKSALNDPVLRCLMFVSRKTSMTVDLVLVGTNNEKPYLDILQNVIFNNLHKVNDVYGIESLLRGGMLTYYITTATEQAQIVNKSGCLTLDEFNSLLNKGLKYV